MKIIKLFISLAIALVTLLSPFAVNFQHLVNASSPMSLKDKEEEFKNLKNDVQKFEKKVRKEKLKYSNYTKENRKEFRGLITRIENLLYEMESKNGLISSTSANAAYGQDTKIIELYLALGSENDSRTTPDITLNDLLTAFDNSNIARDDAIEYAKNNNPKYLNGSLITWDNEADAFRHFSWNYLTTQDIGSNKTKFLTDNHELALHGFDKVESKYTDSSERISEALDVVYDNLPNLLSNKTFFKTEFARNATFMDFYNNGSGRTMALILPYTTDHKAAFSKALEKGVLCTNIDNVSDAIITTAFNLFKS